MLHDAARNCCQTLGRGRDRTRDALSRAESQAAAESLASRLADNLVCCICQEQRKDTALSCGHLLCGECAG